MTIYLAAVFVGGGLLAPWLYWLANGTGIIDTASAPPFHRFVNRSLLLVAVCGIWPFAYYARLDSWRALGLDLSAGWTRELRRGFLLGLFSLGLVAAGAMLSGARVFTANDDIAALAKALGAAAGAAILVSLLEELLFRGLLFGALRQVYHWSIALLTSSALFSIIHFFQKPTLPSGEIKWSSGLALIPQMARGLLDPAIVPGFFVLLLAGAVLAAAYQRRGGLYFAIGLHAGWIFWQKTYGVLTRARPSTHDWLWGTSKMTDGWFAAIVLLFILVLLLRRPSARRAVPTATLGNIEAARRAHGRERVIG